MKTYLAEDRGQLPHLATNLARRILESEERMALLPAFGINKDAFREWAQDLSDMPDHAEVGDPQALPANGIGLEFNFLFNPEFYGVAGGTDHAESDRESGVSDRESGVSDPAESGVPDRLALPADVAGGCRRRL